MRNGTGKKDAGPTFSDTIYAGILSRFLRENPELAKWASEKIETEEGRRNLRSLIHVEEIVHKGRVK